jgi:hypothetical protein
MAVATIKDLLDPLTKIQATSQSSADSLDAISIALGAQVQGDEAILRKLDLLISANSGVTENLDLAMLLQLRSQTKLLTTIAGKKPGKAKAAAGAKGGLPKELKDGAQALKLLGVGAKGMAAGMLLFSIVPKSGIKKFKSALMDLYEIMGNMKSKQVKQGAEAFQIMADSIGKFAVNLVKATLLLPIAFLGIKLLGAAVRMLTPTFEELGKQSKNVNKGAKTLDLMGTSLLSFAKGLVLAGLAALVGIIAIPFLIVSILLIGGAMALLGKLSKPINKGSRTLDKMGDGMKSFAIGLAVFALTTFFIMMQPMILVGMVASLILIGGAVAILGAFNKQINKGSVSLALMGVGLAVFGIGYSIFAFAVAATAPTLEAIGLQAAVLVGLGIATALLGVVFSEVIKGSLALAVMGLGLLVFGIGYIPFTKATSGIGLGDIGIQVAVIGGFGVVFALLGAYEAGLMTGIPLTITLGSIAIAVMGLGLWVFGKGYTPFSKATEGATLKSVAAQAGVLSALALVFAGAGLASIPIGLGALAFGAVGLALQALGPGLQAMKNVDFTQEDALNLTTTLAGVKMAFVGPPKGGGIGGFFKSIGGAITGTIDAGAMAAAAVGFGAAGLALTKLSVGLKDYQKLDWTSDQSLQLSTVLTGITGAFAAAGGEAATPTGIFGAVFGNAFSPNATKKGISSVMGAGKALTSIAEGLTEFQKLVDSKVDFTVLGEAISTTVGFVQRAFAAVAEEGNVDAGGFFGSLFGIKKNKVAEGLDAVQGAGSALTGIAEGLTAFQTLVESKVDFDAVGAAISKSVGFVQEAFAAVADEGNVKAGGFWGSLLGIEKNKVQEGIQSVQGAGSELEKIANALSTFSGIKDPEDTASKIKAVLGMVGQAFAAIGGAENEEESGNWFISWDENKIQKGIQAVDGAGDALTDIAAGLKAFSGDFQPEAVAASIGTLLTSIGTAFSTLYESNPLVSYQLDDFADFIVTLGDVAEKGLLDKAADGISKIADSINKIDIEKTVAFGDLFKSSASLSEDKGAYKALAKAVEDIRDMMADGGGGEGGGEKSAFEKIFKKGDKPTASKGKASTGDPNKKLNSTLGRLEQAITALPTNIQTMKLEVSMPGQ